MKKEPKDEPANLPVADKDAALREKMIAAIKHNNSTMSAAFRRGIRKGNENGK